MLAEAASARFPTGESLSRPDRVLSMSTSALRRLSRLFLEELIDKGMGARNKTGGC